MSGIENNVVAIAGAGGQYHAATYPDSAATRRRNRESNHPAAARGALALLHRVPPHPGGNHLHRHGYLHAAGAARVHAALAQPIASKWRCARGKELRTRPGRPPSVVFVSRFSLPTGPQRTDPEDRMARDASVA